jgi:hypothetical protein
MRVTLLTWCQIQSISSNLRYVNCGPDDIQCNYSSAYWGFNIQVNVSALLLVISRQRNGRYTPNMVPNTEHILEFTLSELRSRTYTMYLQLRIFRHQYSSERICAAAGDISTIQCSLCCKFGANYRAHTPVYAMWTVVPATFNIFTAPHIQSSIFNWTYLRCYFRYLDKTMSVIMQIWCHI